MTEAERYRIQQVRPWLERINIAARAYRRALVLIERLERLADAVGGIDYTREHVSGGGPTDRLADGMDGLILAKEKAETARVEYLAEVNAAAERLRAIPDPELFVVLVACYMEGKETIADAFQELNTTRTKHGLEPYRGSTIYKKHNEAILAAYDVMPTEWRDPRPRAI